MSKALVLFGILIMLGGCATKAEQQKTQEQLDLIEVRLAEFDEFETATMQFVTDELMFRENVQKYNRWVYESIQQMLPVVHRHPSMVDPDEESAD